MRRSLHVLVGAGLAAALAAGYAPCSAQEKKASSSTTRAPAGAPAPRQEGARREPAGFVRVPGGKVRIGITRKALQELVAKTDLGRMGKMVETGIENELSLSTPETTVTLPAFWIGKYEVTNAQWAKFLEQAGRVEYVVPGKDKPGARTLEEMARLHMLGEAFRVQGGGLYYPAANDWKALYEINEDVINPAPAAGGAARPGPDAFKSAALPPGTRVTLYRYTVPPSWKVKGRLQAVPPPGRDSVAVTGVSLVDAIAFGEFYGCHVPSEAEWEAAARGPSGEFWPEGKEFDPLGHAWRGFNIELEKAKLDAKKRIDTAVKRLEEAKGRGEAAGSLQAEVDRLRWILAAAPLPSTDSLDPPAVEVGMFPFGSTHSGAMDMIGNVDEWVSTPLVPYPGTDSGSVWKDARAWIYRGGNLLDKDTLLQATFRKFIAKGHPIGKTFRSNSGGFRVARYDTPGASAALHTVIQAEESEPPILPRESDPKTRAAVGPGLDIYGAAGIELLDEVAWTAAGSPANDPPGKVFFLGRAESVCVVPATGTPFRDAAALRRAAEEKAPVVVPEGQKAPPEKREPRQIPFLGLVHLTEKMEVKGDVLTTSYREVPLTPEEIAALTRAAEERKKAREAREGGGEAAPADGAGGGEAKPPEDGKPKEDGKQKMEGKPSGKGGKGGDKGGKDGGKGGEKGGEPPPAGGGDAAGQDPNKPAEEGTGEEEEEKPEEEKIPTTKKVPVHAYQAGFVRGADYPNGLFLGWLRHGEEVRPVLWEARRGTVGTAAPGGHVLLESPLVLLDKEALTVKKANRAGTPYSTFDETSGEAVFLFFVAVEGKGDVLECSLKLKLGDYRTGAWSTLATR